MADSLDSGSSVQYARAGSSPASRTKNDSRKTVVFLRRHGRRSRQHWGKDGKRMEIWDLYNENRELIGRDHIRGEELPEGCYHLVVHVWIRNSKGEYLVSQRSTDRASFPLMWECVGGSVTKGEDSMVGALRETLEEVGVVLKPENGTLRRSEVRDYVNGERFADILDVWLFEYDGSVELERATTREVAQVKWLRKEQIKELLDAGKMVNTLGYFLSEMAAD